MQIPTWLYVLVMLSVVGGYYWYTVGRHGKDYYKHKFGLGEGENIIHMVSGSYMLDKSLATDVGLALVGMQRVGKTLTVILTDRNRLIISHTSNSDPNIYLEKDQVKIIQAKGETKLPKRSIVEIELKDGRKINLHLAPESIGPLLSWVS